MDNRLKRAPGIYLTGFMGSGKTTVARRLAEQLGWDFVDLDAEIEASEGSPVASIFENRGEAEFRRIENAMVERWRRRVETGQPTVVALGGGSFAQPAIAELLSHHGISIWLDCSFSTITARMDSAERASRPLARDPEAFRRLYEERRMFYERAHFRVDADCEPERAVALIMELPFWK
jgi:shikimate kinase